MNNDILPIDVSSADEEEGTAIVVAKLLLHVTLSKDSSRLLFPRVKDNLQLQAKLIGKVITYPHVKTFHFTPDGRVSLETVDVDFITGLRNAGCALSEIAELMQGASISTDSMIVDDDETTSAPRFEELLDDGRYKERPHDHRDWDSDFHMPSDRLSCRLSLQTPMRTPHDAQSATPTSD